MKVEMGACDTVACVDYMGRRSVSLIFNSTTVHAHLEYNSIA